MSIKCFYHPRVDGPTACKGCRLPICDGCRQGSGLCTKCAKTREAVEDLRELRRVAASKGRIASSDTAKLRLALRQVGPIARREGRAPAAFAHSLLDAGAAPVAADWRSTAMRVDARPSTTTRDTIAQRKARWTYDPARVAYRGVRREPSPLSAAQAWLRRFTSAFVAAMFASLTFLATSHALAGLGHRSHRSPPRAAGAGLPAGLTVGQAPAAPNR